MPEIKSTTQKIAHYKQLLSVQVIFAFLHDVFVACLAWYLSFLLRFNFSLPEGLFGQVLLIISWAIVLQVLVFVVFGLYQGIWRFASIPDLKRIIKSVFASSMIVIAMLYMSSEHNIPRSVIALDPLLLIFMMGGSRFFYRAWKEHRLYGSSQKLGEPVLVIGAGDAALSLVKDLARSEEWRVVGLLDDDVKLHHRQLLGVKVVGSIVNLPRIAQRYGVKKVIIAMPSVDHHLRRRAVELANQNGLVVLTVPAFDDLMSGKVSVSQIRKVEVEDLLGREPVVLDDKGLHELIEDQVVMVSGAGGSIGSELSRQIAKFDPSLLICFDISEYALYQLEQSFHVLHLKIKVVYIVGDVKNSQRLQLILQKYKPAVVFHAAAYKHVPMMENNNVAEALSNNVLGTYRLAEACQKHGVKKFVMVSTDKAVNPTNVMGASKRLAEMVCQGLQNIKDKDSTCFVIVRFGNVLGSSGSVIPKFREQIAAGGPITVTHPEITRYFMSIPEAAQLVMQAGLMGKSAEVFVLDMGESVRIVDLARDMIHLSGLTEDDIKIEFSGLRPGEKLYEELLANDEQTLVTPHSKLRIATARSVDREWLKNLLKWVGTTASMDENAVKEDLKTWVEEYVGDINARS